jgi:hypothetical protein
MWKERSAAREDRFTCRICGRMLVRLGLIKNRTRSSQVRHEYGCSIGTYHYIDPKAENWCEVLQATLRLRLFGNLPANNYHRDPVSKTLYAVQGSNSILRRRIFCDDDVAPHVRHSISIGPPIRDLPLDQRYSFHPWDELTRTTSEVTSLCYLPATGALAVTSQGSDRPPEIFLTDPERDGPVSLFAKLFRPFLC